MFSKQIFVLDTKGSVVTSVFKSFENTEGLIYLCSILMQRLASYIEGPLTSETAEELSTLGAQVSTDAEKHPAVMKGLGPKKLNLCDFKPLMLRFSRDYSVEYFLDEGAVDTVSYIYPVEFDNGEIAAFPDEFKQTFEWKQADLLYQAYKAHSTPCHIWYNPTAEGDCYFAVP